MTGCLAGVGGAATKYHQRVDYVGVAGAVGAVGAEDAAAGTEFLVLDAVETICPVACVAVAIVYLGDGEGVIECRVYRYDPGGHLQVEGVAAEVVGSRIRLDWAAVAAVFFGGPRDLQRAVLLLPCLMEPHSVACLGVVPRAAAAAGHQNLEVACG